ncbi:hypothetical protein KIPB_011125 [Kipferlia bialata]|uniref:Uncharacterized protein n=1 Tax=Kipferlia bialata TaxID=797122 RepID=A0A9K3D498_9EUKA|nr:hypothetical protein KIPB_011125 [Kipferlia bialata]|eukprot:g11125.t1
MVTYSVPNRPRTWCILHLQPDHTVVSEDIVGPDVSSDVYGIQLVRVGHHIVAYGGYSWASSRHEDVPVWCLALYPLDTGVWESIPHTRESCPFRQFFSYTFALEESLFVAGGTDDIHMAGPYR